MTFLERDCLGGVSDAMSNKLRGTELALRAQFTAQAATGAFTGSFADWAAMREVHRAAHTGGQHTAGNALDVNFTSNPYIATRTPVGAGVVYGGEATALPAIRMVRIAATQVYDRAVAFLGAASDVANVSARASAETTASVYGRFQAASTALAQYLGLAIPPTLPASAAPPPTVTRRPVPNAAAAPLAALAGAIPVGERLDDAAARANIAGVVGDPGFAGVHPGWSVDVDFWFQQILRDYEVVRIPMVIGASPSLSPAATRNPANGFLDLREEIVEALCDLPLTAVMRWGVSDFGAQESGDVQHFDLAPRIPSGVAGSSPPEVRIDLATTAGVQQALASLGIDPGPIDGQRGPGTSAAIAAFRGQEGIGPGDVDEDFTGHLRAALRRAAVPFAGVDAEE